MMGPSHALSGASAWLAGSWALDHFAGYGQSPLAVAVGATVCAGAALLPDLDLSGKVTRNQGGATVARTFGVFSLFAAEVIEKVSLGIYTATKLQPRPAPHQRAPDLHPHAAVRRPGRLGHHRAVRRTTASGRSSGSSS